MAQLDHQFYKQSLSPAYRLGLALGSIAGYLLLFAPLYHVLGLATGALVIVPLFIVGWLFGWRWGAVAGLLALPAQMLALKLGGEQSWLVVLGQSASADTIALLPIGAISGWLGEMLTRVRQQSAELEQERRRMSESAALGIASQLALQESEQRFRSLIQDLQVGVLLQGPHSEILLSNQAARDLLGLSEAQLLGRDSFAPDWQVIRQDGTPFLSEAHPVPQAIATGQPVRDVVMGVLRPASNDWIWLLVDAQPQLAPDGSVRQVICTLSDITARQQTDLALRRHDAMLEAVSFAAACFLETPHWELVIDTVLERLGVATAVSRVYIFANHRAEDGRMLTSQVFEWSAPGVIPQLANQELQRFSFHERGFERWEALLSQGEPIQGDVQDFPPAERELLSSHAIDSIVLVPIFAGQEWWGHIGLDQCDGKRHWSVSDMDVLKAAANLLGSAIERERVELTLRDSEQRYRDLFASARRQALDLALLDHVRASLARELDLYSLFRTIVEAIANAFGYTHVSVYLLQGEQLELQHQVGCEQPQSTLSVHQGLLGRVASSGDSLLIDDARAEAGSQDADPSVRSEIAVPLFDQGEVAGVLNIKSHGDTVLQDADLRIMIAITGHINIAIERARLYARVRESERRYRLVLESLKEVVFQTNLDGVWMLLNPAWAEITGFPVAETIGRACFEYVDPADLRTQQALFQALINRKLPYCQEELRYRTSAGSTCWVELCARPTFDERGAAIGISGTLADITARKQAEEERRLIERKMLEAQKLESLGVLAGGIAHDFNNLLMAILGNAELALLDLAPNDLAQEPLQQIQITAKRAGELTSQMLAYAGKGKFVIQRFDLNVLVEEITGLLRISIAKTTTLRYNLAANLPPIEGDAAQIRQVVMNLVMNAAEAIGDQEGLLTISTGVRQLDQIHPDRARPALDLPEGPYVFLEVSDTGSGMSEDTMAKIFDPFFTTKFAGRGLGLAAVIGIVRGHHGALKVRSTLGEGTSFTISLPVAAPLAVESPALEAGLPALILPTGRRQQTILVADDEKGVRLATAALLERAGFQVLLAADGRAAVELFQARRYEIDAVLIDLMMPHMNGEEALRALRAIQPDLQAVIMSGYNETELSSRFYDLDPVSFLQKPFSAQALYHNIEQMLARRAQPYSLPTSI